MGRDVDDGEVEDVLVAREEEADDEKAEEGGQSGSDQGHAPTCRHRSLRALGHVCELT